MRLRTRLLIVAAGALCVITAGTPDPDSDRLANRLGSCRASERDAAAAELAALGSAATPALDQASASDDPEVRLRSQLLLAGMTTTPASDAAWRRSVATAWLRSRPLDRGALAAGSPLDAALADTAPESTDALAEDVLAARGLVDAAADALVRRPTAAALDALVTLWEQDRLVPSSALPAAWTLERALDAAPELRRYGRPAAERLVRSTLPANGPRRRIRVALIAALAGDDAREFLIRAADDPESGVRAESVRALGRRFAAPAAPLLRELATDGDADVRVAALEALLRVPGSPHPEPACRNAADPLPKVRRAAADLLARDATPSELPLLARLACDSSVSVRASARRALRALEPLPR